MLASIVRLYWPFLEAMKNGKIIEHRPPGSNHWGAISDPEFVDPPECYRIKPEPVPLKELWAVYRGKEIEVIRDTKTQAEQWCGCHTCYTVVQMREVREESSI